MNHVANGPDYREGGLTGRPAVLNPFDLEDAGSGSVLLRPYELFGQPRKEQRLRIALLDGLPRAANLHPEAMRPDHG